MTSPIRQNLFERECDMPLLEARHLALLLLGLDASQPANALPEEHQENYRILHDAISRTIKATGMVSAPANKRMFYADEMFALAWRLIDDELTPPEIKARSISATKHGRILPGSAGYWFSFWLMRLTDGMARLINRLRIGYFGS